MSRSRRSRTGSRRRGGNAAARADTGYLDWALAEFSGYLAADEVYDGPFCVLSAVDARLQHRLRCEVLDHDPTQVDVLWFLARLNGHLAARGHTVRGITTDGSPLYPRPIAFALGAVPHQVCEFHVLKELTRAVLRALRAIMDEVYRLFDRRCRTDTAQAKLARLRQRVRRYRTLGKSLDKLQSPNMEKALTFLDDRLLAATSNVVERANRRHRKMQKTIYRARTQDSLRGRVALDLQRDEQAPMRAATLNCLHKSRKQP